jgi:hypothetical protein
VTKYANPSILSNRITLKSGLRHSLTVDNHRLLYFVALHVVTWLAGDSKFAMRILSLACGALATQGVIR